MQQAYLRLTQPGAGLARLLVTGEAGVGKTRLLHEFERWADTRAERCCRLQGRVQPQTRGQPYGLLRELLAWWLQIADSDPLQQARRKVEDGLAPLLHDGTGAHLLGHLVGLDFSDSPHVQALAGDGRQLRARAFDAAALWLCRLAAAQGLPLLMLLEDLHWADDGSLDFLAHLAQTQPDLPLLVLALARPDFAADQPAWAVGTGVQQLLLAPLDALQSHQLADELLQRLGEVPALLRELITGRAEGNPFYMEELVRMLVDQGAIDTAGERWTVHAERLLASQVPVTLVGVLQARLDGLAPAERLALQRAAVIGPVFWDQALQAVHADAPAALPALVRRELVAPATGSRYQGATEYSFRHQVLQQVAYDTLLRPARRDAHARVATWLAGTGEARADDHLGLVATHFDKAGQVRPAADFYGRAATQAHARFAHREVIDYATRGLALVPAVDADDAAARRLRLQLLTVRERTLNLRGQRAEQQADLDALDALAEQLDDDHARGHVARHRCDMALRVGDWAALERYAQASIAAAERVGDRVARLRALYWLMPLADQRGDLQTMVSTAEAGLAEARALGEARLESDFLEGLGIASMLRNDLQGHMDALQQSMQICERLGLRKNVAIASNNLGCALLQCGADAAARAHLQTALRLAREVGDRQTEPYPLIALSMLDLRQGEKQSALAQAVQALETARAVRDPINEAAALVRMGWAELALGDAAAAVRNFLQAQAVAQSVQHVFVLDAAAGLVEEALQRGDAPAVQRAAQPLADWLRQGLSFTRCYEPAKVFLAAQQALAETEPAAAAAALQAGRTWARQQADGLRDPQLRVSHAQWMPAALLAPAEPAAAISPAAG